MSTRQLTAAEILAVNDVPAPTEVYVPEWGGVVYVRTLMGYERDRFELAQSKIPEGERGENFKARFCVYCVVDKDGTPLFEPHQAAELGRKSAGAVARIFDVAAPLNGLTEQHAEELAGN